MPGVMMAGGAGGMLQAFVLVITFMISRERREVTVIYGTIVQ
jgi:hypothetical protein